MKQPLCKRNAIRGAETQAQKLCDGDGKEQRVSSQQPPWRSIILKEEISKRLKADLEAAQAGIAWEAKDDSRVSGEVLEYTFDQKCKEHA